MNPSPQFLDFELQVVRNTVGVLEVQILDSPRDRPAAPFQPPCAFAAGYLVDVKAGTEITVRQRSPRGTDDWRAAGPRFGRPGLARVPSPIPSRQQPTSKRRASTSPRQPPMFGRRAIARKSRQPWMSIARDRARSPTTSESPARDRAAVQPSRKPVPRDRAAPPRVKIPRRATAQPLRQPRLARRAGARSVRRPLRAASRDRAAAPSTLVEKSAKSPSRSRTAKESVCAGAGAGSASAAAKSVAPEASTSRPQALLARVTKLGWASIPKTNRAIERVKNLLAVGQTHHQGVVASLTGIGEIRSLLAFAAGLTDCSVDIDPGKLPALGRLRQPNPSAHLVDRLL